MDINLWLNDKQGKNFHYKMEKIRYAVQLLGQPQLSFPTIHIAGTNGKGSTIAFLNQLLQSQGLRVGAFVSPHMETVCDRITINGHPITQADFEDLAGQVYQLEQVVAERYEAFRYFEVLTLIMLLYFREQQPDVALIEVGIGGLHDTTNIVQPLLSIITSIGLDHQELLGDTVSSITEQKAGIIKAATPVVTGPLPREARLICQAVAEKNQSPLFQYGLDFQLDKGLFSDSQTQLGISKLGLEGKHQEENAAVALKSFFIAMSKLERPLLTDSISAALAQCHWAGRLEKVAEQPAIYLDGAHNVPAIQRLVEFIQSSGRQNCTILFAALKRKDFHDMLDYLSTTLPTAQLVVTQFDYDGVIQASDAEPYTFVPNFLSFLTNWKNEAKKDSTLIITGSLYFISEVRQLIQSKRL